MVTITIDRNAADKLKAWKRRTWNEVYGYATGQTGYVAPDHPIGIAIAQLIELGGRGACVQGPDHEPYIVSDVVFCGYLGGPEPRGYYFAG
jgi:hypothetical protein